MFDLDQAIAEWRRQMQAGGVTDPGQLDELEGHLREETIRLMSAGRLGNEAFQTACSDLGTPASILSEFKKLNQPEGPFVISASVLYAGTLLVLVVFLLKRWLTGRLTPLLCAHIFSVIAGYSAMFLAGGLGAHYVFCRWRGRLNAAHGQWLRHKGLWLTRVSAALVAVALLSGMVWARQHLGRYVTGDPREIGAWLALAWLLGNLAVYRSRRVGNQAAVTLCLCSSLITGAAWFGGVLLARGRASVEIGTAVTFGCIACLHLFFLGMNLAPRRELADT